MRNRIFFISIVLVQLAIIAFLFVRLNRPQYAISVTPFSRQDVLRMPNDRLRYFYDLATEASTSIPEWLSPKPVYLRNHDQLNDRYDYALAKTPGTFRIITLGDSWTFGMHVSTKNSYSEVLEDTLNGDLRSGVLSCKGITTFEVLNFGVGGYDIEYMLERLRQRGIKYHPDLIIPLIKADDFIAVNELWTPKIQEMQKAYGDELNVTVVNGVAHNPRQEIMQKVTQELSAKYSDTDLTNYEGRALDRLPSFYSGEILFMVFSVLSAQQEAILAQYAKKHAGAFIAPASQALVPEEMIEHDGHPNILGHARLAKELYKNLLTKKVIPCDVASPR